MLKVIAFGLKNPFYSNQLSILFPHFTLPPLRILLFCLNSIEIDFALPKFIIK